MVLIGLPLNGAAQMDGRYSLHLAYAATLEVAQHDDACEKNLS
jgi:hypothetical protein